MKTKKDKLTQDELKKLLHYNPISGVFTWKRHRGGSAKIGTRAGWVDPNGYRCIRVNGIRWQASRLAWLHVYGYDAECMIDHKNGKTNDDRILNLREASYSCNGQNCKTRDDNSSGFTGVSRHRKSWNSRIHVNGKTISLRYHKDKLNAAKARLAAEILHPGWTCNYRSELVKCIKKADSGFDFETFKETVADKYPKLKEKFTQKEHK